MSFPLAAPRSAHPSPMKWPHRSTIFSALSGVTINFFVPFPDYSRRSCHLCSNILHNPIVSFAIPTAYPHPDSVLLMFLSAYLFVSCLHPWSLIWAYNSHAQRWKPYGLAGFCVLHGHRYSLPYSFFIRQRVDIPFDFSSCSAIVSRMINSSPFFRHRGVHHRFPLADFPESPFFLKIFLNYKFLIPMQIAGKSALTIGSQLFTYFELRSVTSRGIWRVDDHRSVSPISSFSPFWRPCSYKTNLLSPRLFHKSVALSCNFSTSVGISSFYLFLTPLLLFSVKFW